MMRPALSLPLLILLAAPAGAGCFAADGMPGKARYEGGTVLDYLGLDDGVLTYRSGKLTSRLQHGIWPLEQSSDGFRMVYTWDGPLPDLKAVAAAGGKVQVTGRRAAGSATAVPVSAEIEILGAETVEWEDCRYDAVRFRKSLSVAGKLESQGVLLYAPAAMIAFRTEVTELSTGTPYSYALEALE